MSIPYDLFAGEFLGKISEFNFIKLEEADRTAVVDGYMKRALNAFKKNCMYDLFTTRNDDERCFMIDIPDSEIDEITDIVSDGMVVQWLKPFVHKQELLENTLNTKDFTTYSPAELLMRIGNAHNNAQKDYIQKIREYSFNHGDLTDLHL